MVSKHEQCFLYLILSGNVVLHIIYTVYLSRASRSPNRKKGCFSSCADSSEKVDDDKWADVKQPSSLNVSDASVHCTSTCNVHKVKVFWDISIRGLANKHWLYAYYRNSIYETLSVSHYRMRFR